MSDKSTPSGSGSSTPDRPSTSTASSSLYRPYTINHQTRNPWATQGPRPVLPPRPVVPPPPATQFQTRGVWQLPTVPHQPQPDPRAHPEIPTAVVHPRQRVPTANERAMLQPSQMTREQIAAQLADYLNSGFRPITEHPAFVQFAPAPSPQYCLHFPLVVVNPTSNARDPRNRRPALQSNAPGIDLTFYSRRGSFVDPNGFEVLLNHCGSPPVHLYRSYGDRPPALRLIVTISEDRAITLNASDSGNDEEEAPHQDSLTPPRSPEVIDLSNRNDSPNDSDSDDSVIEVPVTPMLRERGSFTAMRRVRFVTRHPQDESPSPMFEDP